MIKILIAGAHSFIGTSVERWLLKDKDKFKVSTASTFNEEWKRLDFTKYDVVINVAGIAHRRITPDMEPLFYRVNRDLAIELCQRAKESGVKQYIYLSSMNVYGDMNEIIKKDTKPVPKNFYGMSKLQADMGIQAMNNEQFKVVSIRPPVVYGRGCKGNFVKLEKLTKVTPIFPEYHNKRSLIYIDNLCEFIKLMILNAEAGVFHPQNREYISTTGIVKEMAAVNHRKILYTKLLNPLIHMLLPKVRVMNRIFGDDLYDMALSDYKNFSYCLVDFEESIRRMKT